MTKENNFLARSIYKKHKKDKNKQRKQPTLKIVHHIDRKINDSNVLD